jgi:hypothetical protein
MKTKLVTGAFTQQSFLKSTVLHILPGLLFSVFLLGTLLGYVVWWQLGIRSSIGLHVTANAFVRLAFLLVALSM